MNRRGFTLIELVLVIAILGILAVSALPKFLDLGGKAKQAARDGVVGAVRSGIALYKANTLVTTGTGTYPTNLSTQTSNNACTTCFDVVLTSPVNDNSWTKSSDTVYIHSDGGNNSTFTYNPTNGTFQ